MLKYLLPIVNNISSAENQIEIDTYMSKEINYHKKVKWKPTNKCGTYINNGSCKSVSVRLEN